jgi:hypothetical protein
MILFKIAATRILPTIFVGLQFAALSFNLLPSIMARGALFFRKAEKKPFEPELLVNTSAGKP